MEERSLSIERATPGYCTFTATARPSGSAALCTCRRRPNSRRRLTQPAPPNAPPTRGASGGGSTHLPDRGGGDRDVAEVGELFAPARAKARRHRRVELRR
eukprot:SAG11_NODE_6996_length_1211_cov_3.189748_2_plen_99_part_01